MKIWRILLRIAVGITAFLIGAAAVSLTPPPCTADFKVNAFAPVEISPTENVEILLDREAYAVYSAVLSEKGLSGEAIVIKSLTGAEKRAELNMRLAENVQRHLVDC